MINYTYFRLVAEFLNSKQKRKQKSVSDPKVRPVNMLAYLMKVSKGGQLLNLRSHREGHRKHKQDRPTLKPCLSFLYASFLFLPNSDASRLSCKGKEYGEGSNRVTVSILQFCTKSS